MTLLILYLLLAIGVSFLCSILEAVLLSITPSHIAVMNEQGHASGKLLRQLKRDIDRPLSAILTVNTFAHTFGAAGVGAQAQIVFGQAWLTVISAVVTLLILIFSEIIPKTLGATYWKALAPFTAHACRWLIVLTWPLVKMSQYITRLLGKGKKGPTVSREELRMLAQVSRDEGVLDEEEAGIFVNLIRFGAIRVEDIMTPRVVVERFQQDTTLDEAKNREGGLPFSRYPVYGADDEDITGYVLKSEIMLALAEGQGGTPLKTLKRDVLFVPEFISLRVVFSQLLTEQEHFAVVVDEYGGFTGLVTMEDVLETLLGMEIVDESDTTENLRRVARERWMQRAKKMGLELPHTVVPEGADDVRTKPED
ncbi:HlyC/CorC family transporter [Wenzhouxiangella sp. XN79A]|uniref:hemolysin family protein n=1 Tax=Wenzhouxiangella sp. XN79A TaxID=2724193 RepID=UPI00144AACC9|nr:hemolysin family protein [Wenzhouxiangella sp. XN79A]NKI35201.1 HlyC/CorC family transporter [Wenzhouxiangella sp. XN79A]